MPLYQYLCSSCGRTTEEVGSVSTRDASATCEACGGACTRNLFPGTSAIRAGFGPSANAGRADDSSGEPKGMATAVKLGANATGVFNGNTFKGMGRAIVAHPNAKLSVTNNKFQDVDVPVERTKR